MNFQELVSVELARARTIHPKSPDLEDLFYTLDSQLSKFRILITAEPHPPPPPFVLERLVKIATLAQRAAEDFLQ